MIVIQIYSFELDDSELMRLARMIGVHMNMRAYPLPLAADELHGRHVELILTPSKMLLAP